MALNSLTKLTRSASVVVTSSQATYTSARLQVESTTASRVEPRAASACSARSMPRTWKSRRSRSSTGAVLWLIPTSSRCMVRTSEVVTPGEEIADRQKIEQHDREADRRQIGGPPAAPADPGRREQLERVHRPADERHEDFRILE